jgi:hypothetical protein
MNKLIIISDFVLGTILSFWTNQLLPLLHYILGIERKPDVEVLQITVEHV